MRKSLYLFLVILLTSFLFIACGNKSEKEISMGSKNFAESILLAEIYAQYFEHNGFTVERKMNLGTTDIAHQALLKEDIDMYPDYTSTCLLTVLKKDAIFDKDEVLKTIQDDYLTNYNLTILNAAPMNNNQALAVTKETAEKYSLKTLSDLSKVASELKLGCPPEFLHREDGLKGLQNTYGSFEFHKASSFDISLRYTALINKDIDVTVAFTTDGEILTHELIVLEDDKNLWPSYHSVPIFRKEIIDDYPELEELSNTISEHLTNDVVQAMNVEIKEGNLEIPDIAKEFLIEEKLIK